MSEMQPIRNVEPDTVHQWMQSGEAVVVDVRSLGSRQIRYIEGTLEMPLRDLDPGAIQVKPGQSLVFQCEVGVASMRAARIAAANGVDVPIYNLRGGIREWMRRGLPVHETGLAPVRRNRRIQVLSSLCLIAGIALGIWVSPWFVLLAGSAAAVLVLTVISP